VEQLIEELQRKDPNAKVGVRMRNPHGHQDDAPGAEAEYVTEDHSGFAFEVYVEGCPQ
jgi:hypothetical protein